MTAKLTATNFVVTDTTSDDNYWADHIESSAKVTSANGVGEIEWAVEDGMFRGSPTCASGASAVVKITGSYEGNPVALVAVA